MKGQSLRYLLAGFFFAVLWASASSAGKIGLNSAEGLLLFTVRFLLAGAIMILYAMIVQGERLPKEREWLRLFIFGLLNTTIYLGVFIVALEEVTAGLTSIALALNPLMIGVMTAVLLKRPVERIEWISIGVGICGVLAATYPLLISSAATVRGVIMLGSCMIAYSMASVYYSAVSWKLSSMAINGWQVMIGGVLLIPFTIVFHTKENHLDSQFWLSIFWLVIPVSVGAVQLWLYLLKTDTVRASLWLFLCPIFGLMYASWLLDEPFTVFTAVGTGLVLLALYMGQSAMLKKG